MWSSRAAQHASRERTVRTLIRRQEEARASAYEWRGRARRYLIVAAVAFVGSWWWWLLWIGSVLAGLAALLSWEKAARDQCEGNLDLGEIVAEADELDYAG